MKPKAVYYKKMLRVERQLLKQRITYIFSALFYIEIRFRRYNS
ncbi:hypothetical protein ZPR_1543 [Zunongwangia profunda SM-A87]|uniref:Uncharacterized protein n=1 Tax=Zunongwangia profunda (strain DSM 18752 / CCTCC AB 206139 / SM-A87) TaxID=655815 RepID=D5BKX9_ZUNPS|nr:hypothetical protein ZPR_1543 [Zunongwangia profunda SM-A87]